MFVYLGRKRVSVEQVQGELSVCPEFIQTEGSDYSIIIFLAPESDKNKNIDTKKTATYMIN